LDCTIDLGTCLGCGSNSVDGVESCDGADLDGMACSDLGFDGGTLACDASCEFVTSGCNGCGNGIVESGEGEQCDTDNVPSDCLSEGFEGGTLLCSDLCQYDLGTCFDYAQLNLLFSGSGTVAVDPSGTLCYGACAEDHPEGTPVTLTASPDPAQIFESWSGAPGCDTDPVCQFSLDADTIVTANFAIDLASANVAFVTNADFTGDMGSRDAADALCTSAANNAGYAGNYWALLADSSQSPGQTNAPDRFLQAGTGGWVGTDGRVFATSASDLFDNTHLRYPLDLDELGASQAGQTVWTGMTVGYAEAGASCSDWTVTTGQGGVGVAGYTATNWAGGSNYHACGGAFALTCLGVDSNQTLIMPDTGSLRTVFLSSGVYGSSASGVAALDQACQDEAAVAGLANNGETFLAMVATTNSSPLGRFMQPGESEPSGPMWARTDGVRIAASMYDLVNGDLSAPISVYADGSHATSAYSVWVGASGINSINWHCDDWTADVGNGHYGSTQRKATTFSGNDTGCSTDLRIYCAQE
jgi:hypothetical protein